MIRLLVIALLCASPTFAVPTGDYRAESGVTFVKPSSLGLGGYQSVIQLISCPEITSPPGGGCENLFQESDSDQEVDLQAEPDGCTIGTDCYETDGGVSLQTTPAGDMSAEPDRNSLACTAILHPISTWESTIEYDDAEDGYPLDEVYANCTVVRAFQGAAGHTYRPWVSILNDNWPLAEVTLTMVCGATTRTWNSGDAAPNPIPQIALTADTACTLTMFTQSYINATPELPERDMRLSSHFRTGVDFWATQMGGGGCGIGIELALLLPVLRTMRWKRN